MPRPRCCRRIVGLPACKVFKPVGLHLDDLEAVSLSLEEYEAIRLADHEGLYQEEAARRMGVSRQTFGRTIEKARAKVARALVLGCALRIEIPEAEAGKPSAQSDFLCKACGHSWKATCGPGGPKACPGCGGDDFRRTCCTGTGSPCAHTPSPNQP